MNFSDYVQDISRRFSTGDAREHTYRGSLQNLLESIIPNIQATNEPARIKCGAPDYVLTRKELPVGYIEAKDIGEPLDKVEKTEQLKRYLESLDNLILTDYLEFRFFKNKEKVETIRIAEVNGKTIRAIPENFEKLKTLLIDFAAFQGQTIKSSKKLAEMMAHKARLMRDVFRATLESEGESTLKDQMNAFKAILMHDLDEAQFADIYAQTIAYGLFTARLHDKTLEDFSRSEALLLIPASNPFLRQLFSYMAGSELDPRVVWIVDALCEVYRATNLAEILKDFGKSTGQRDPILHFYETFLGEYDASLRKSRGVWYTPEPVVQFIVRAIDDVLKDHFGLKEGIADTSKIKIKVSAQEKDSRTKTGRKMYEREVHKVQLLDVATGTGTFLAEAIKQIYRKFEGQEGLWSQYVERDLIPRLHGFELLMASYAMCHMKLDLLLRETGYDVTKSKNKQRLSVYLTNSLEEEHKDSYLPFTNWLSNEANQASEIKRDMPIMIAFGNPPYSGHSSNNGEWIENLISEYKKEPSGGKLQEKNSKWLNDDYVKFIRLGEYYIEKNGEGVLAYITNHSYLDNPTFRGMRWKLLNTFDDIYILDLHGNAKKKEVSPDGTPDKNVFDIQQGVAIIIAIKKKSEGKKKTLANIYHCDVWGDRQEKYDFLERKVLKNIKWKDLSPTENFYMFIPRNDDLLREYSMMPQLSDIIPVNVLGFQTHRDNLAISFSKEDMEFRILDLIGTEKSDKEIVSSYKIKESASWSIGRAREKLRQDSEQSIISKCTYRPFDRRYCLYHNSVNDRPRRELLDHVAWKKNICLNIVRQTKSASWQHCVISDSPTPAVFVEMKDGSNVFPLYLYNIGIEDTDEKRTNFNDKIYKKIKKSVPDITPESLFDYIYAVLHAPKYRTRYAEFLKSDFPRIPYPENPAVFHSLAQKGAELRDLHLMESSLLESRLTTYPVDGDHIVEKPRFEDSKVYINATQYFGNVPEVAWNFYIGGYQPAQKWLKDRKGRTLTIDDIRHYQHIIIALTETPRIMSEIDQIDFLPEVK